MSFGRDVICDVWAPRNLSLSTAVIASFLSVITFPGNLLICISVLKDPNKDLRSSFNFFVLNLALSDLISGLVTEPIFVWYHASEADGDPVTRFLWIVHVTYFISCLASLLSIAALAIDRYLTVTSRYRRKIPIQKVIYVSIAIWLLSFSISMIYFATTFFKFVLIFSNVATMTTLGIITFSYVKIYQNLHSHVDKRAGSISSRSQVKILKYEKKATRAFLYILVVFIFFNVPSCIMAYVINFCVTCDCETIHWLRDFQFLSALFNCSANQFLYALRMPLFIRAIRSVLKWCPFSLPLASRIDVTSVGTPSESKVKQRKSSNNQQSNDQK